MFRLDGKVALITGAGSGIGAEIARAFARQGASVAVCDINEGAAMQVASEIGPAVPRMLDVTSPASVHAAFDWVVEELGSVDVLVNNAGIGLVGSVEETSEEDFRKLHDVNVSGVFNCCRKAVQVMLGQGGGAIINIGSVAGLIGVERRFAYCSTKGAVVAMTRQLAIDYASRNIRANCICPGTVDTPFVQSYLERFHAGEIEETRARLHARQPVGRMGTPEDVAGLAVYLASDESSFATGSIMTLDGGWTAR